MWRLVGVMADVKAGIAARIETDVEAAVKTLTKILIFPGFDKYLSTSASHHQIP